MINVDLGGAIEAFWRDDARPVFEGGDAKKNAQEFTRIMVQITSRLGAVPGALINELRGGGLSGVAAEEVTAAQRIKALRDEGFELQEIPRDERQRAELIDEFAGIGLKSELAGEAVEGFVAPELLLTHPVGQARQTLYPLLP
jgi:hypothetical protein